MTLGSYELRDVKLGRAHGNPRVWLEGTRLAKAGFDAGKRYTLQIGDGAVSLRIDPDGARVVSAHNKKGSSQPVIDINSARALHLFEGLERLRVVMRCGEIYLMPLASQVKARERLNRITDKMRRRQPLSVGSLCHGGGTTAYAMHEGFTRGGVPTHLNFANDIDPEVLERAAAVNPSWSPDTAPIAAPLQEIVTDAWLLRQLGHVDVLEAGLPCTAASLSGRAKKGLKMPEEDPDAGHLVVAFLALIEALQPAVIVLENVPPYQNTASAWLIRHTLRDWGYNVAEAVLDAHDFGSVEARKRLALVAMTAGLSFDFAAVVKDATSHRLAEVLEPVPLDAPCWSEMGYLRDKQERDQAAGKGFRMQIVGPESERIGVIGRDYQKNRSTEAKVRHPIQGDALLRLLTPREHARIKAVPEAFIDGMPATRAHRLLGNGVAVQAFAALARALAQCLRDAVFGEAVSVAA